MFEIDRVAAVVKPTASMLEWLNNQPGQTDNLTLETLRKDCLVLLIPAFDGPNQALEYIKQIYRGIFEAELISWGVKKRDWPEDMSLERFNQWFELEFHSILYDVAYIEQREKENSGT